jgi:hypothetical protein
MAEDESGQVTNPQGGTEKPNQAPATPVPASPASPQPQQPQAQASTSQPQQSQPLLATPFVEAPEHDDQPDASEAQPVVSGSVTSAEERTEPMQDASEQEQTEPFSPFQADTDDDYFSQDTGPQSLATPHDAIKWTASEYIAHAKSAGWFVALAVITLVIAVIVWFVSKGDIISTLVVVLVATIFGIYAGRKPREQQYELSMDGVHIGPKLYHFNELKSFSIVDEGAFASITFLPMKRFMPLLSIYYDPADEEKIVEFLKDYLPMEDRGHDAIDRLMRKIKF